MTPFFSSDESSDNSISTNVVSFEQARLKCSKRARRTSALNAPDTEQWARCERPVAAVVTVTRFIAGEKVHVQVPVFTDEIIGTRERPIDFEIAPELSELLADGAVQANSFLDRLCAAAAAQPYEDYVG